MAKKDKPEQKPKSDDKKPNAKGGGCMSMSILTLLIIVVAISILVKLSQHASGSAGNSGSNNGKGAQVTRSNGDADSNQYGLANFSSKTVVVPPQPTVKSVPFTSAKGVWSEPPIDVANYNDIKVRPATPTAKYEILVNGGAANEFTMGVTDGKWWKKPKNGAARPFTDMADTFTIQVKSLTEPILEGTVTMVPK
jgi:hypothetical protein